MKPVEYIEMIKDIADADFMKIVGQENMVPFAQYVIEIEQAGQDKIVFRMLQQISHEDGMATPFYLWVTFSIADESAEIITPDFDVLETYLNVPEELVGYEFFEI